MGVFEIKKDKRGEFYWSIRSKKNGESIAKSSESYATRASAMASVKWMKTKAAEAEVVDLSKEVPAKKVAKKKK